MENLFLSHLPDLPQCITLKEVTERLWTNDEIMALWIEGSLARGAGDLFSDVDLHIVITPELLARWKNLATIASQGQQRISRQEGGKLDGGVRAIAFGLPPLWHYYYKL
jgi:predicted nucleotidyltransferase